MATPAYSLHEALEHAEELQDIFASRQHDALSEDQVLDIAATLIRRADDLLAHLPGDGTAETREMITLRKLVQTLRSTAFLLMQEVDHDQASYWTQENQARI